MKRQPLIIKNVFANDDSDHHEAFLKPTIAMWLDLFRNYQDRKPKDPTQWSVPAVVVPYSEQPRITWMGHASFLIQLAGCNILVDPVFGHVAHVFRRILPVGITPDALPPIDAVLISHNHRDHADVPSLRNIQKYNPHVKIYAPLGDKKWLEKKGFTFVYELQWWQQAVVKDLKITFLPARHWTKRDAIGGRNTSLWGSWMIESPCARLYFGGDTAYWTHFSEIKNEFGPIDVALLPIGPCEPRAFMNNVHLGPEQSVQAFIDLDAQTFIPMHWGTFFFGIDRFDQPIQQLINAWKMQSNNLVAKQLQCLASGQHFELQSRFTQDQSHFFVERHPLV
jgi:L-ascorbate metabolism protein UlaG (beta-lactamase superfamily)